MTLTASPAALRTDASAEQRTDVRRTGFAVAAGALIWAGAMAIYHPQTTDPVGITVSDLGALPFQISLFMLVTTQLKTLATGTSKAARGMLRVEYGLLSLATLWTVLHGLVPSFRDDAWLAVLDLFWPLSMLGMFVIGVKIALAGRWRGAARIWPLIAESWAVVTVPTMAVFGALAGQVVGAGHLVVGYATLGLILAFRPELTRR